MENLTMTTSTTVSLPSPESVTTTNPLLLDLVLNKVFETLKVEDLLRCRLVCKSWLLNSTLKTGIRNKSVIYLRCIFLHTATTRENLPDYFQLSGPIYHHFHFVHISYQNDLISRLFQVVGPSIKILKLQLDLNQLNIDQFREIVYERVPNLKELNIYSLSHEEVFLKKLFPPTSPPLSEPERPNHVNLQKLEIQEIRTPISRFMTQFLETLPNIREITLKVDVCSDWADQADLWRPNSPIATSVIKGLEMSKAFKTLTVLQCGKLCIRHIESLVEMGSAGLQLETLEVHMPPKHAEEAFNAFISTQQDSLKKLIIFEQKNARYSNRPRHNNGRNEIFGLRLPETMSKLELLQLSKFTKSVTVPVYPVDYTRQCPRLKQLIFLGYSDTHGRASLYIPTEKCSSLDELYLWNRVNDPNIAYILEQSFPNLTILTVRHPNKDFLKTLWSSCPKIQKLALYLEEGIPMDEGLTGVPTSIVTGWLASSTPDDNPIKDEVLSILDWMGYNKSHVENSIRNLKDLRSLKIVVDHDDVCDRQAICDASAYFALNEMTHLRYLELYTSHWHCGLTHCQFFSQECLYILKIQLALTVIHLTPDDDD